MVTYIDVWKINLLINISFYIPKSIRQHWKQRRNSWLCGLFRGRQKCKSTPLPFYRSRDVPEDTQTSPSMSENTYFSPIIVWFIFWRFPLFSLAASPNGGEWNLLGEYAPRASFVITGSFSPGSFGRQEEGHSQLQMVLHLQFEAFAWARGN